MKILSLFLSIVILPGLCLAAPFLVCDPQEGVTHYGVTFTGQDKQVVAAQTDSSLKYDLGAVPEGENSVSVTAIKDTAWGRLESAPAPFVFRRPGKPTPPIGIGLR